MTVLAHKHLDPLCCSLRLCTTRQNFLGLVAAVVVEIITGRSGTCLPWKASSQGLCKPTLPTGGLQGQGRGQGCCSLWLQHVGILLSGATAVWNRPLS